MTPARIALILLFPFAGLTTEALAQSPEARAALERARALQAQQRPAVPGAPSLGAEIDQMLEQVPGGAQRAPGSRETVGQEIDRLVGRPGAAPAQRRNVRAGIENRTQHNILVVQMTPVDRPEWTANLLRERFNPGVTLTWRLNDGCRYDVRITLDEGNEFTRFDHDFCAQERITLTAIDAADMPAPRERVAFYRVVNQTGATVYTVHATPAGARRPGPDLLGQWVMAEGDHYTGRVRRGAQCLYDLRITFTADGREATTLPRQNLCESSMVVLPRRAG